MTIPEIRAELLQIGQNLGGVIGARIMWLAQETRRRPPAKHKAPPRPEPYIAKAQIVRFFRAHPDANYQDAAEHFGVNMRKISNVYGGVRR